MILTPARKIDAHRYTLRHLDEVSEGVLRRQHREHRAGSRRQRRHRSLETLAAHLVNGNVDLLARQQCRELRFP